MIEFIEHPFVQGFLWGLVFSFWVHKIWNMEVNKDA